MLPPLLSRDDIFISYSRADGAPYATGLADRLTAKGFSCFLDRLGTEPDRGLPRSLRRRIRSCTMAVLVATEGGAASAFVEQEIAEFLRTRRTVVPIDFGGAVARARWYPLILGLAAEPERDPAAAERGDPSDNVISRIEKSFRYTRRNQHMLRVFWATVVSFLAVIGSGLGMVYWSTGRANEARGWAELRSATARRMTVLAAASKKEAERQQAFAKTQTEIAAAASLETRRQQRLAKQSLSMARERLIDLSQEQGRLELLRGNPMQGLVYLNDAYGQRANDEALRFLISVARRSLAISFQAAPEKARLRESARNGMLDLSRTFGLDLHYVAYSADGSRIVTAASDAIHVWNARTGASEVEIDEPASFAEFVDGGRHILSQYRSAVKLWDAQDGALVRVFPELKGNDRSPAIDEVTKLSPDGKRLLVPGNPAKVFDIESGELLFDLASEGKSGRHAAIFSPDGATIATIHGDAVVSLWRGDNGKKIATLPTGGTVIAATFSPDSTMLVTGIKNVAKVWDTGTGSLLNTLEGHTSQIYSAAFSPDGTLLATGEVRSVMLWDVHREFKLLHTLEGKVDRVTRLVFNRHGQRLIALSADPHNASARVWDVHQGRLLESLPGEMTTALFSPDGEHLLTTNPEDRITIWDVGKDLLLDAFVDASDERTVAAALSPDRHTLAIADGAGEIQLWDAKGRRLLHSIPTHTTCLMEALFVDESVHVSVNTAAFSRDSKQIALPLPQGGVAITDVDSGVTKKTLPDAGHVVFAAFAHDGARLVTIAADSEAAGRVAEVWDTIAGRKVHRLVAKELLRDAEFNVDDRLLLTNYANGGCGVWDVATGKNLYSVPGSRATFSPDGKIILTVETTPAKGTPVRATAELFDARSGRSLRRYEHPGRLSDASFSRDGKWLVTADTDGAARVFDIHASKLVLLLEHQVPVDNVEFSPDGGRIATADLNGVIRIWDRKRGQILGILYGHSSRRFGLRSLAFSEDGALLLSVGWAPDRGVVRLWDVHTESEASTVVAAAIGRLVPADVMNTVMRQRFP